MRNKILKIFFVVIAIAVFALGIYFVFFGYDRKLSVYNGLNNVMDYKYRIDCDESLVGLESYGYNDNTVMFTESEANVYNIRQRLFKIDGKLTGGSAESEIFNYYGYAKYEEIITAGIKYYSNYTGLATTVRKQVTNTVCSHINSYKASLITLQEKALSIKDLQKSYGQEGGTELDTLTQQYQQLRVLYRDYLSKASLLLIKVRDFVVEKCYNNTYSFETEAVLYDSVAETIYTAMNSDINQEINYLNDASIYVDLFTEYQTNHTLSSYGIADEIQYLYAYNKLYLNDRADYNRIFDFTHFQKKDLLYDNNNIGSQFAIEYVDYATIVVALLGI